MLSGTVSIVYVISRHLAPAGQNDGLLPSFALVGGDAGETSTTGPGPEIAMAGAWGGTAPGAGGVPTGLSAGGSPTSALSSTSFERFHEPWVFPSKGGGGGGAAKGGGGGGPTALPSGKGGGASHSVSSSTLTTSSSGLRFAARFACGKRLTGCEPLATSPRWRWMPSP